MPKLINGLWYRKYTASQIRKYEISFILTRRICKNVLRNLNNTKRILNVKTR